MLGLARAWESSRRFSGSDLETKRQVGTGLSPRRLALQSAFRLQREIGEETAGFLSAGPLPAPPGFW